jgi:LysM repeat protein
VSKPGKDERRMIRNLRLQLTLGGLALALAACQPAPPVLPSAATQPAPAAELRTATEQHAGTDTPQPVHTPVPTATPSTGIANLPAVLPSATANVVDTPVVPPVAATVTPLARPSPEATDTAPAIYVVVAGDSLSAIAAAFDTTVNAIMSANGLTTDLIVPGQELRIPGEAGTAGVPADAPAVPAVSGVPAPPYRFSPLEGALTAGYPAMLDSERFTLHYSPDVAAGFDPHATLALVNAVLVHHERVFGVTLAGRFDVYMAATLFAPPDQALRGRSFSANRRTFILADGSGNAADQRYIAAHELTHLYTWNTFGAPSSVLLSEGAAVYAGMLFAAPNEHLSLEQFCAAYLAAGVLPPVAQELSFLGHIRDLENYYAAGCFVEYLIDTYGVEPFGRLYPSGNYAAIYGKTLAALEADWQATLAAHSLPLSVAPESLVAGVDALQAAYGQIFTNFSGTPDELAAYRALDSARIALMEGRLEVVQAFFADQ